MVVKSTPTVAEPDPEVPLPVLLSAWLLPPVILKLALLLTEALFDSLTLIESVLLIVELLAELAPVWVLEAERVPLVIDPAPIAESEAPALALMSVFTLDWRLVEPPMAEPEPVLLLDTLPPVLMLPPILFEAVPELLTLLVVLLTILAVALFDELAPVVPLLVVTESILPAVGKVQLRLPLFKVEVTRKVPLTSPPRVEPERVLLLAELPPMSALTVALLPTEALLVALTERTVVALRAALLVEDEPVVVLLALLAKANVVPVAKTTLNEATVMRTPLRMVDKSIRPPN